MDEVVAVAAQAQPRERQRQRLIRLQEDDRASQLQILKRRERLGGQGARGASICMKVACTPQGAARRRGGQRSAQRLRLRAWEPLPATALPCVGVAGSQHHAPADDQAAPGALESAGLLKPLSGAALPGTPTQREPPAGARRAVRPVFSQAGVAQAAEGPCEALADPPAGHPPLRPRNPAQRPAAGGAGWGPRP